LPLFVDIPFDAGGMVLMSKTRRSDGRMHDSGLIRPNRPCPKDFREKFIELGWGGIGFTTTLAGGASAAGFSNAGETS
jgi:hypothetical protein